MLNVNFRSAEGSLNSSSRVSFVFRKKKAELFILTQDRVAGARI
jgi:hypothetical protein